MDTLTPVTDLFAKPYQRRFKTLTLPVSGFVVRIRSVTEKELSAHQRSAYAFKDGTPVAQRANYESATRRLIALCLCDENGNRILSNEDAAELSEWDSADTSFLYNECSNWTRTKPEDIEATVKN